ncbi:FKBP-type peptidyl-prolyl cis-trans isomerase [Telmatobacter sp. DSM 110680]|uniref:Peptidyl-prolyl cis-trans isomerase n=1 Tax=Telmatobacter sp. DSM 110680 TaxID=3036704 RepID=A0AAU7DKK2_9BACT
MKQFIFCIFVALTALTCFAQTPAKPAAPRAAAKPVTTATGVKLPPGVPPARGILKTAFSLRYQDVHIGTGAEAEPNKIYKVNYTGWLAADGHKFDSSYDHKSPVMGKDGKPEMDADGKPKMSDGEPISFPQGFGRVIPGFDQGFTGMKIGGKRRLFIPWQLAYGSRGRPGPSAANPGIPPKADLIFDIELVDVSEMPAPPVRPGMGAGPNGQPMRMMPRPGAPGTVPGGPGTPAAPASPATPGTTPPPTAAPANPATPSAAGTPPPSTAPATPPSPSTTQPPTDKPQSK